MPTRAHCSSNNFSNRSRLGNSLCSDNRARSIPIRERDRKSHRKICSGLVVYSNLQDVSRWDAGGTSNAIVGPVTLKQGVILINGYTEREIKSIYPSTRSIGCGSCLGRAFVIRTTRAQVCIAVWGCSIVNVRRASWRRKHRRISGCNSRCISKGASNIRSVSGRISECAGRTGYATGKLHTS